MYIYRYIHSLFHLHHLTTRSKLLLREICLTVQTFFKLVINGGKSY